MAALQAVAQLDRGERVEAELLEGLLGLDRGGGGVAEDGGDLGADQVEDDGLALGLGQRGELGGQRAGAGAGGGPGTRTRPRSSGGRVAGPAAWARRAARSSAERERRLGDRRRAPRRRAPGPARR